MSDVRSASESKHDNHAPEFNSKDVLLWKLKFSGFLRRFDCSDVLLCDEPVEPSLEKIRETQEKIISARGTVHWENTQRTRVLLRKYEAERALWKKQTI